MELESKSVWDGNEMRSTWINQNYDDWRDHIFDDVVKDISKYFGFETYAKASKTDRYFL